MGKPGRKPMYSPELGLKFCDHVSGGLSVKAACAQDGMPEAASIYRWLVKYPEFKIAYENARAQQADALFDQALAIADGDGEYATKDPKERRLMVDTRKWMAGKLQGRYSERVTVDTNVNVSHIHKLDRLTDEQLEQLEQILTLAEGSESGEVKALPSPVH